MSSSTSSSKNKNLLAAKSALGLTTSAATTVGGGVGNVGESSSKIIGSDGNASIISDNARSVNTTAATSKDHKNKFPHSSATSLSSTIRGGEHEPSIASSSTRSTTSNNKHSFIHDLSAAARQEARRTSSSSGGGQSSSDNSTIVSRARSTRSRTTASAGVGSVKSGISGQESIDTSRATSAPRGGGGARSTNSSHISYGASTTVTRSSSTGRSRLTPGPAPPSLATTTQQQQGPSSLLSDTPWWYTPSTTTSQHKSATTANSSHNSGLDYTAGTLAGRSSKAEEHTAQIINEGPGATMVMTASINDASTVDGGSDFDSMMEHPTTTTTTIVGPSSSTVASTHRGRDIDYSTNLFQSSNMSGMTTLRSSHTSGLSSKHSFGISGIISKETSEGGGGLLLENNSESSFQNVYESKKEDDNTIVTIQQPLGTPLQSSSLTIVDNDDHEPGTPGTFEPSTKSVQQEEDSMTLLGDSESHLGTINAASQTTTSTSKSTTTTTTKSYVNKPKKSSSSRNSLSSSYNNSTILSSSHNTSSFHSSSSSSRQQQQKHTSSTNSQTNFVPQKFNEMRTLLSAITPIQLEALMYEIFNTTPSLAPTSLNFPQGWSGTSKKARSRKFRKDAYLSEMSLKEIRRYCIDKNIIGMNDDTVVKSVDDALDLLSVEFERLVSAYQNDMNVNDNNDDVQSASVASVATYNESLVDIQDEGANLRQSLRACSIPELRLVAERLQLVNYMDCGNDKERLIEMIEGSMPEMMKKKKNQGGGRNNNINNEQSVGSLSTEYVDVYEGSSQESGDLYYNNEQQPRFDHHDDQQQQQGGYYDDPQQHHDENRMHDNDLPQEEENEEDDQYRKRIKFAPNTKKDTSHLIPKREKSGSWQSFVVGADGIRRYHDEENIDDYYYGNDDGEGGGYRDNDGNIDTARPLFRNSSSKKRHRSNNNNGGNRRRRATRFDISNRLPSQLQDIYSTMPEMPFKGKRLKVLGFIVLLTIIISLSVTLTKDDGTNDGSNMLIPDMNDPFYQNFFGGNDPTVGPSKSLSPSVSPSMVEENDDESAPKPSLSWFGGENNDDAEEEIIDDGEDEEDNNVQMEDDEEVVDDNEEDENAEEAIVVVVEEISQSPTVSPVVSFFLPSPDEASDVSSSPTTTPNSDTISDTSNTSSPSIQSNEEMTTSTTTEPTTPEYPLLGPYDESNMRMILYGIADLDNMGRTQFQMLTAAYVEQFFNHEGQVEDAIQNIVFDVVASVEINSQEPLNVRRGRRRSLRELQSSGSSGLIVTFTMTISYRTFSSFITSNTVAERPFYDEDMRAKYIDFLRANGSVMHMGEIPRVSAIFYGDDIPEDDEAVLMPSLSPLFVLPVIDLTPRPTEYPVTAAPTTKEIITPEPSPSPTDKEETNEPSPSPTERGTTLEPSPTPSKKPTTPDPTPMPVETYYPTPTALLANLPTYAPVPQQVAPGEVEDNRTTSSPVDSPKSTAVNIITGSPTMKPTQEKALPPTVSPSNYCESPVTDPICPFLVESKCCQPMCTWDSTVGRCSFIDGNNNNENEWVGEFEIAQTHVVKAVNEKRHAPKVVAHREAELLFTPGISSERKLDLHEKSSISNKPERIESVGTVYLVKEEGGTTILDASVQRLVDGSNTVFSLPNDSSGIDIIVDLNSLRLVEEVSIVLHGDTALGSAKLGLHYDDGRNQEESERFQLPNSGWEWLDFSTLSQSASENVSGRLSISFSKRQARYVMIRMVGGRSESAQNWGFSNIEIHGVMDGLSPNASVLPMTRAIDTTSRSFTPPGSASVFVSVYSPSGTLIGTMKARDPSKQRDILERHLSVSQIPDYSETIWSVSLPFNWVDEGNIVLIGCVDPSSPEELLVHRLEFNNLEQFSEHTITRTKMVIFGDESQVARLDTNTHEAKRLARNLFGVMPVAELKWVDTDIFYLPYVVVMGKEGPVLVNSEEERRKATGVGEEIAWTVMKSFLTIRHSLAQTGFGLSVTSREGANSPYASGTSVFMGWSLSKHNENNEDEWEWEDLGYWDTLAAAAWTGWCVMKPGDECSNYFVHEIGHAQTMQHFDKGTSAAWGIEDEYPEDGKHMSHHPWGYDTVARQFRTWYDPIQGDGKLDPLNGAGEDPTSMQCFTQYTPYQAMKAQDWASKTPLLLSSSTSNVETDGAYEFDSSTRQYLPLKGAAFTDAVGESGMQPDQVGVPVLTFIGTIGKDIHVCQTYPGLRSRAGNTFDFPDPFNSELPSAYTGAAHYVEIKLDGGETIRGLIAVEKDLNVQALHFYSFNVAIDLHPVSVSLYRFTDSSYPNVSPESAVELLHLRPTGLQPDYPLEGLPPLLRVGRGWLGDSADIILDRFCITSDDCQSDMYNVQWRSNGASDDSVVYKSSLTPEPGYLVGSSVFKVPTARLGSTEEYTITLLATRFYNDGVSSLPLLKKNIPSDDGSSDIDVTHGIRIVAPWEMNGSLPSGTYHTLLPGALKIKAEDDDSKILLELDISLNLHTITDAPTPSPTKKPSPGPSQSPVQVRWYIDWNDFTCVTDGESTEWAPPYESKEDCCHAHMAYDFA